jgi:dihydrofolate reductase
MRRLTAFNSVSLDGYFVDATGDMSWAHQGADAEWNEFVSGNAQGGGTLVFGRVTYQMMAGYWPSPIAKKNDPVVAERMNALPKVVFSRTLTDASWRNTTLVEDDMPGAIRRMKKEPGDAMVILGSGTIVAQLTQQKLIDEYQIIVIPVVLGGGRTMFEGVTDKPRFKLTGSRTFRNGNAMLRYQPQP